LLLDFTGVVLIVFFADTVAITQIGFFFIYFISV
jgi:hypothetical protein